MPVTVNGPSEVELIAKLNLGIEIEIASDDGKPLLSDILAAIRKRGGQRAAIVNADCRILEYPDLASAIAAGLKNGLLYAERVDVGDGRHPTIGECHGFDAFFFDIGVLGPPNVHPFRLGETWWDYWFPFYLATNGASLGNITSPLIVHRRHSARWSREHWRTNGQHHWAQMKVWHDQNALPAFFSDIQMCSSEPTYAQMSEFGSACYEWLRTRKVPQNLTCLPAEMESLQALLREAYDTFAMLPKLEAELRAARKSWLHRLNRRRLSWQRRTFGRRSNGRRRAERLSEKSLQAH